MRTSPVIFQFTRLFATEGHSVPMIRLRGQWLRQIGFAPGKRIAVAAERKRLVITLDDGK